MPNGVRHLICKTISNSDAQKSIPIFFQSDVDGKYELNSTRDQNNYLDKVSLKWEGAKPGGTSCISLKLFATAGSNYPFTNPIPITTVVGKFPPASSGATTTEISLRSYNVTTTAQIFIEFVDLEPAKVGGASVGPAYTDMNSIQVPNSVRLYFPATRNDLWVSESSLIKASKHFDTLLSSDYHEGKILTEIRNDSSTYEKDFDDSDDEQETETVSDGIAVDSKEPIKSAAPFKQIKIDSIAHSTYRALLCWLQTSHISFAPLLSEYRLSQDPAGKRNATIQKLIKKLDPALPPPVSPKSIYRLAHYYDIPALKQLALDEIRSQLTVENIAFEVFGDLSKTFEEVREIELDFAVKNWDLVKVSKAMEEVERLVEEEELPSFAAVSVKLYRRLRA